MKISKGGKLLILGALLLVFDQTAKILVKTNMSLGQSFDVFSWFKICFIENEGMAFGMKFGGVAGKYVLSTFRVALFAVLTCWIYKLSKKPETPTGVLVGLTLIDVGALGNIIDCLFYGLIFSASVFGGPVAEFGGSYASFLQGRVVDMLYFPLIDTYIAGKHITFFDPVFNVADSCVTVGAFYLILFKWRFFKSLD